MKYLFSSEEMEWIKKVVYVFRFWHIDDEDSLRVVMQKTCGKLMYDWPSKARLR